MLFLKSGRLLRKIWALLKKSSPIFRLVSPSLRSHHTPGLRNSIKKKKDDSFIEIDDKDPVWLKDKADHFFKRHDFQAAVMAYGKALKEDPEFLMARLNRATSYIKVRGF